MARARNASGFMAQDKLMNYATPEIAHVLTPASNWENARIMAGLTWEPILEPVYDARGTAIPNSRNVAHENGQSIAVVTKGFRLINHHSFGTVIDTVAKIHGTGVSAALALDNGCRIGARVTHGTINLPFDPSPIDLETWGWLRHDAKGALSLHENAHRIDCTNQLGWVMNRRNTDVTKVVTHRGNVEERLKALIDAIRLDADWAAWTKEMTTAAVTKMPAHAWTQFVNEWIPIPEDPEKNTTRAQHSQDVLHSVFDRYSKDLGQNVYAAFQAVTEYEDQFRTAHGNAGRFNRAIQPNPRRTRAYRTLMAVAA